MANNSRINKDKRLSHADLMAILAIKSNRAQSTVEMVYKALIETIKEELCLNGVITLKHIGRLETYISEAGMKKIPKRTGGSVTQYYPPKAKVRFKTSEELINELNKLLFDYDEKKEKEREELLKSKELPEAILVKKVIKIPVVRPVKKKKDKIKKQSLDNLANDMKEDLLSILEKDR